MQQTIWLLWLCVVLLLPLYFSVSERRNSDTNETEVYVGERKLTGYSSYTADTSKNSFNLIQFTCMSMDIFDSVLISS